MDNAPPLPYDHDSESENSDSDMELYEDRAYSMLENGSLRARCTSQSEEYICPFCPSKKRKFYPYEQLLQHASGVANSPSRKRNMEEKASHRVLVKYLQTKMANSTAKAVPSSKRQKIENLIPYCDHNEKLVYPWKGIVVNIQTSMRGVKPVGDSGSKLRDEYIERGFNARKVRPLWNYQGHTGKAIVEFNKSWSGLNGALLFDKVYREDGHGKGDWLREGAKSGLYAWLARAEDYNGEDIIGERLRKTGDLRTIAELAEILKE